MISVVVVTYNSASTVIDTINSILNQTYNDIEIIVTDDGSTDDTVEKVKKICANEIPIVVVEAEHNEGLVANVNKGIKAACGSLIKLIAGDDILEPNALQVYLERYSSDSICFSKFECFGGDQGRVNLINQNYENQKYFFELSQKHQKREMLRKNMVFAPASGLISKRLYEELDYYDERYMFMEDYPFWIKALKYGMKFELIDMPLVQYRVSATTLSGTHKGRLFKDEAKFFWSERIWMMIREGLFIDVIKTMLYFIRD